MELSRKPRATLADVAHAAGVSHQTVSRAVNNKGQVHPVTKRRVLRVAARLGYRPSGIARSLATQRTGTVGLVVPDITNPFFSGIARGVEDTAFALGYKVFLCNSAEALSRERAALDSLLETQVDGLILCSSRLAAAELARRVREFSFVVLINRACPSAAPRTAAIWMDDVRGARLAVDHLLANGRRSIALLAGPSSSWSSRQRRRGFVQRLQQRGLSPDADLIVACGPDTQSGHEAARRLLERRPEVSAIVAFNDLVAVGALQACRELGRAVPEQMALVGFDDIPLAGLVTPALTTLRVARAELGASAMRTLAAALRGQPPANRQTTFEPELVVRASAP